MLGDLLIGTNPPLVLRVLPTQTNRLELYCGGVLIEDEYEQKLLWYMMRFGSWSGSDPIENTDGNTLLSIDLMIAPEEWDPAEGFATIGFLSDMISRYYQYLTAPDGETIKYLSPKAEPGSLGIVIPSDYEGKALPLWQFQCGPDS